ncbi:MAG TPA: hypothetical protein VIA07_07750, partial [Desulfuromonadales bacterium]
KSGRRSLSLLKTFIWLKLQMFILIFEIFKTLVWRLLNTYTRCLQRRELQNRRRGYHAEKKGLPVFSQRR